MLTKMNGMKRSTIDRTTKSNIDKTMLVKIAGDNSVRIIEMMIGMKTVTMTMIKINNIDLLNHKNEAEMTSQIKAEIIKILRIDLQRRTKSLKMNRPTMKDSTRNCPMIFIFKKLQRGKSSAEWRRKRDAG